MKKLLALLVTTFISVNLFAAESTILEYPTDTPVYHKTTFKRKIYFGNYKEKQEGKMEGVLTLVQDEPAELTFLLKDYKDNDEGAQEKTKEIQSKLIGKIIPVEYDEEEGYFNITDFDSIETCYDTNLEMLPDIAMTLLFSFRGEELFEGQEGTIKFFDDNFTYTVKKINSKWIYIDVGFTNIEDGITAEVKIKAKFNRNNALVHDIQIDIRAYGMTDGGDFEFVHKFDIESELVK